MNAGSLRKDCLADFLVRWVDWLAGAALVFGGFGFITSLRSPPPPPPPPPPPAAKTGTPAGLATSATVKIAGIINLIANLNIGASCSSDGPTSWLYQPRPVRRIPSS